MAMSRNELTAAITARLTDEDLTILRNARFKKHPLCASWFYFLVAWNRYTPFLIPIRGKTMWGHELQAYETSAIGSIYFLGFYDVDLTLFLLRHYQEAGDVLDVGANVGVHTSLFSYLAAPGARVVAFEPTPSTASVLRKNSATLTNVTVEQTALADREGTISFIDYGLRHGVFNSAQAQPLPFLKDQGTKIEVASTTLDQYVAKHGLKPSLIKLDTEGTEAGILAQSSETLRRYQPTILLELGGGEAWAENAAQCIDTLAAHGYSFFNATREGDLLPHERQVHYQYQNLIAIHTSKLPAYAAHT
jgi:FkbM family methyltransferase